MLVKGKFEIVKLGGMMIGRATYEPGWKWTRMLDLRLVQVRCANLDCSLEQRGERPFL
jgi:hypothetical protein